MTAVTNSEARKRAEGRDHHDRPEHSDDFYQDYLGEVLYTEAQVTTRINEALERAACLLERGEHVPTYYRAWSAAVVREGVRL